VSIRFPHPWYFPLIPSLATLQGQAAEQTIVPVAADPSSKSVSSQTKGAQDRDDTIEHLSPATNVSTREAKDDATITVNSADPLGYARHRRENISQKQMKAEHPLAKPRQMKVWDQPYFVDIHLIHRRNSTPGRMHSSISSCKVVTRNDWLLSTILRTDRKSSSPSMHPSSSTFSCSSFKCTQPSLRALCRCLQPLRTRSWTWYRHALCLPLPGWPRGQASTSTPWGELGLKRSGSLCSVV
jgi:hypothetical protein